MFERPSAARLAPILLVLSLSGGLRAEPDPCDAGATVSPCFDADALWVPTGATRFVTLPSARPLAAQSSTLLLAGGLALHPVLLHVPSPDPEGREVHVVSATTTLTLGVGFGLGRGFGFHVELPFVPYQKGTGVEGVTSQSAPPLGSAAVRDPRLGVAWTALGADPREAVALAARFELVPPLGNEELLAGTRGTTFAPGATLSFETDRLAVGLDAGLRLRSAVDFGTVRKGSEAIVGAGVATGVFSSPLVTLGVEAWLRPGLAGSPPGTAPDALDLPAEWLATSTFAWDPEGPFSLAVAAGSGIPLSHGKAPSGERNSFAGVTAPSFRALAALRFDPRVSE
jgi:hypothetical protein